VSWPTSDDWKRTIFRTHRRVRRLEVLANGSTVAVIPTTGGETTIDETQAVRRRSTIPVLDATGALVPDASTDLLYPAGNEIRVWVGIDYGDDRAGIPPDVAPAGCELVPVMTGPLYQNDAQDQPGGLTLSLDVYDRSRLVQRNRWIDPFLITAGAKWSDILELALLSRLPGTVTVSTDGIPDRPETAAQNLATAAGADTDPWADMTGWATAIGCEILFDGLGNPILRDVPDLSDAVVADYRGGQDQGLLSIQKTLSQENAYNGVVASGQASGNAAPVRAVVWDDDPSSPTYYLRGPNPYFYVSPLLSTVAQCQTAGAALLRSVVGASELLKATAKNDPSRFEGDVVTVRRDRVHVDARYIFSAFNVPHTAQDAMSVTMRKRGSG
jgi:hypothetical protein